MDPRELTDLIRRLGAEGAARVLPQLVLAEVTEVSSDGTRVKVKRQEETSADPRWYVHLKTYSPSVGDVVLALQQQNVLWVLGDVG